MEEHASHYGLFVSMIFNERVYLTIFHKALKDRIVAIIILRKNQCFPF